MAVPSGPDIVRVRVGVRVRVRARARGTLGPVPPETRRPLAGTRGARGSAAACRPGLGVGSGLGSGIGSPPCAQGRLTGWGG